MSKANSFVRIATAFAMAAGSVLAVATPANAGGGFFGHNGPVDRMLKESDRNNRAQDNWDIQSNWSYAGDVEICTNRAGRTQYCPPRPGCIIAQNNPYSYNPVYLCRNDY